MDNRDVLPGSKQLQILEGIVNPWYESLKNPSESQQKTLEDLLRKYGTTRYGVQHGANEIQSVRDYRERFPSVDYKALSTYYGDVVKGDYRVILPEPPLTWVMTRGSTGPAKVLPATKTHIEQIFSCGARAIVNYALRKKDLEVLTGRILNLNFPSSVHTMDQDGRTISYGYSSGTYARLNPMLNQVSLLPRQEDIDALGSGIGKADWEKRFELAYEKSLDQNVTATMGVTPVILFFARYVKKRHGKLPKDLWKFHALFCTSVRKIQFKYAPLLQKYFGNIPIVEMYTATEGAFAQQLDDLPYVTPNYDSYVFEVDMGKETKMLHELKRGEWGKLIISSCMFPRYDIGDLVEAAGNNYFRVIGRKKSLTILEHRLYRLFFRWFT